MLALRARQEEQREGVTAVGRAGARGLPPDLLRAPASSPLGLFTGPVVAFATHVLILPSPPSVRFPAPSTPSRSPAAYCHLSSRGPLAPSFIVSLPFTLSHVAVSSTRILAFPCISGVFPRPAGKVQAEIAVRIPREMQDQHSPPGQQQPYREAA